MPNAGVYDRMNWCGDRLAGTDDAVQDGGRLLR
jgi:hypothetical protein